MYTPDGWQKLTGGGAVQAATVPSGTRAVRISCETVASRFTLDKDYPPTSANGHEIGAGVTVWIENVILSDLQFYLPATSVLQISYFK